MPIQALQIKEVLFFTNLFPSPITPTKIKIKEMNKRKILVSFSILYFPSKQDVFFKQVVF